MLLPALSFLHFRAPLTPWYPVAVPAASVRRPPRHSSSSAVTGARDLLFFPASAGGFWAPPASEGGQLTSHSLAPPRTAPSASATSMGDASPLPPLPPSLVDVPTDAYTYVPAAATGAATSRSGGGPAGVALLLIHPVGVGISRSFWVPFLSAWAAARGSVGSTVGGVTAAAAYAPDLYGSGDALPPVGVTPPIRDLFTATAAAEQLLEFARVTVRGPVVLVSQGASVGIAAAAAAAAAPGEVMGWVAFTPPTPPPQPRRRRSNEREGVGGGGACERGGGGGGGSLASSATWAVLCRVGGPLYRATFGSAPFIRAFSARVLFDGPVPAEWVAATAAAAAVEPRRRWAIYAFLAGSYEVDVRQKAAAAVAAGVPGVLVVASRGRGGGAGTTDVPDAADPAAAAAAAVDAAATAWADAVAAVEVAAVAGGKVLPYEYPVESVAAVEQAVTRIIVGRTAAAAGSGLP